MNDQARLEELNELSSTKKYVTFNMTSGTMSQNGGATWVTQLKLGMPSQTVNMMIDTGTENTWVTSKTCTTEACLAHQSFNPEKSKTYTVVGKKPTIEDFGPWGQMGVIFGKDICQLDSPSMKVPFEELLIMLATSYTGNDFKELVGDGGLCIPSIPDPKATAILHKLYKQNFIETPLACFYWNKTRGVGECRMGALNPEYYKPETLKRLPLVRPTGGKFVEYLWAVKMDSLIVDGQAVYDEKVETQLVLDTGSSFFKGASDIIDPLISAVTGAGERPTTLDKEEKLKDYPVMHIRLGGVDYLLEPEQYFVKIKDEWVLAIQVLRGMPPGMLLVGQVFLETVYSIFDFGGGTFKDRAVILAELIHQPLAELTHQPLNVMGIWENEFGSRLEVGKISSNGTFQGSYSSDTGATGVYPVMGVADPNPGDCQTVAFSVTWKSEKGESNPSWHYVSGFTGTLTIVNGKEVLNVTFLLQRNITNEVPAYEATSVSALIFRRK